MTAPTTELNDDDFDTLLNADFSDEPSDVPATPPPAQPEPDDSPAVEAQPPAPALPAATPAGETPRRPDGTFAPKPADAPVTPAAVTPPAAPPATFALPDGGQPFTFKVDGEELAPKGALSFPGQGVWIPEQVWNREIRPNYLGSRQAWRQTHRDLTQRIADSDRNAATERQIAERMQQELVALIDSGPEGIQQWLQNYQQNAPLMKAKIEATRAQQELEAIRAAQSEAQEAAQAEELRPRLQGWLLEGVKQSISSTPELAVLGDTPEEIAGIATELWETYGQALFWEAEQADPSRGIAKGAIFVHAPNLLAALSREAQKAHQIRERLQRASTAQQRNAAALTPSTPPPAPTRATPPATPTGTRRTQPPRRHESESVDDIVEAEFKDFAM